MKDAYYFNFLSFGHFSQEICREKRKNIGRNPRPY
jgi:hypothetical protein